MKCHRNRPGLIDAAARGATLAAEFHPDTEKVAQYERKILARRYAGLLRSISHRRRESDAHEPASLTEEAV